MEKDEETARLTEHIIPQNVLRPSKVLGLLPVLSATWCMEGIGSAELDSERPGFLVPWCTPAQRLYLRSHCMEHKTHACLASQLRTLAQNADALE